jgi:hypothetical protein
MIQKLLIPVAAAALFASSGMAGAQSPAPTADGMAGPPTPMHGLPVGGDGPNYTGSPDLGTTSALAQAGGGAATFSIATALTAMVGPDLTNKEVAKLTKQYGKKSVGDWITVFDYVVQDGAATAASAGVTIPAPDPALQGKALAAALVKDGAGDGTFWTGTMLDHLVSHGVHVAVMDSIDVKFGPAMDGNYHRITDQAMYDLAQALGATSVQLASFH